MVQTSAFHQQWNVNENREAEATALFEITLALEK